MLRLIMIICCCLLQQQIISQTFNVADNYNTNGIFYESVAMSKSAIYTNGYGSEISSPLSPKLYISKFSPKGDFIYNKGYSEPGLALFSSPQGLIIRNDSIFNFGEVQGNGYFNRIYCLITDTTGNKLFFKEYLDTTSENEVLYQSQLIKDKKGYLLVGSIQKSGSFNINAGVFFLNNKFELIKKYQYGSTDKNEIAYSAAQLHNGNIVIGAHRTDAQRVNGTRYQEQTWIFEIDTNGNMVRQFIDPDTRTGPAKGITQSVSGGGGFVYCGRKQSYWNGKATYYYGGTIAKLKPDYSSKDWESIVTDTSSNILGMEQLKITNKGFYGVGTTIAFTETNDFKRIVAGRIIKFDESGHIKWGRNYVGKDSINQFYSNFLYDVMVDNDQSLICTGKVEQVQGPNLGWILKLDSTGCLTPSNCGYPALSTQEITPLEKTLTIHPNPFTSFLNIEGDDEIEKIEIYDVFGKLVHKENTIKNSLQLGHLPNGLYLLKCTTDNNLHFTKKIVKY